jgi:hypothetical protein
MTYSFLDVAEAVKAGEPISAEHVLAARRWAWGDGGISATEAESIFELNRLAAERSPEWVDFFVEAITEYVVNQQPPRGYIDEANAAWLQAQVDSDGKVETLAELEMLVKVLETALNAPESFKAYVLSQIEEVVTTGQGPTRRGGDVRPGTVDEAEVALLRRLVFASGGSGALTVSRDEAEMLWRIKDTCRNGTNAPGWKQLFVQALGNHLMAHSIYNPLLRSEAERLEAFVADHETNIGRFLGRMASSMASPPVRQVFGRKAPSTFDAELASSQAVVPTGDSWVGAQIDSDGEVDDFEQALLAFIAEENGGQG